MASLTRRGITIGSALVLALGLSTPGFAQFGPYPYGYRYAAPDASVRFDVKPKDAAVYVDGYYAGLVDDYDGAFQRLRTTPGAHEITLYLEGYRTHSEKVYLAPDNTFKFKTRMEKLAAGETAERPPAPQPPPAPPQVQSAPGDQGQGPQPGPYRGPIRRGRGMPYPPYPPTGPETAPPPQPGAPAENAPADASGRGTLSLSLQPADADILVDGTPWKSDGGEHLTIDLPAGRHNLQIRKTGYVGYLTDVQIRAGQTTNLDIQLKTQPR